MERQDKKAQFEEKKRSGLIPLLALGLVLVATAATAWVLWGGSGSAREVRAVNGQISIPLTEVSDGKAHFFTYRSGSTNVGFFVLKSGDGVVRAALDTCDVCYKDKKGYRQEGEFMICNNCDQQFRSDRINEIRGGCNPVPLERTIAGDRLLLSEAELVGGTRYFQ
ncbi:MAG: DUF2318 domain-containing protein [Desulfuromonadales bacterium]|nr:DUF2318 domain-containing protein [Desulfuromonadales bacterium]